MRSSARVAVPTFLALICFAAITFAQVPPKQPAPKVPRGSISGRITIKDKPAAGVMVGLRRNDGMNPFDQFGRATTDQDGVYRITNVAPGSYFVLPSTPAYVFAEANYGSRTIVIREDESVENVDYSLVRGGVITGKVTDADGRPVIQVPVNIFRADLLDKQAPVRQTYPTNSGMTDDRGVYRIFGILPGKYKVAAGRSDEFGSGYAVVTNNYKQVFHPDVSDVAKATTIEVSEASEAKDVDITLGRTMQTFSVSGHVINNDNGLPVPNVRYGLTRSTGDHSEYVSSGITSDARGDFVIEGLLPGKYAILQFSSEGNELRPETTGFEIIDQDLTDLAIKLTKGASISGSVVLESDDKAARSRLLQLQLRGSIMISPNFATSTSSLIAADGSFHFTGLQNGVVRLSIGEKNMPFPPKGFSISRIERDGAVIPQLQVKDGETISGVKIFVTYGNASLRGTINTENGELPTSVHFAVRLTKLGDINSNIRPPQVDARGHFLIEGIPAGVYEVSAYILGSPAKQNRSSAKQNVTLVDGAVTDVTLTIDLAP
jgi:5-hydroxyisourate hydrolase-like protein (transthyretin family)